MSLTKREGKKRASGSSRPRSTDASASGGLDGDRQTGVPLHTSREVQWTGGPPPPYVEDSTAEGRRRERDRVAQLRGAVGTTRRGRVLAMLQSARAEGPARPTIGVSNRPALGYDLAALGGRREMRVQSLPAGHRPVSRRKHKDTPTKAELATEGREKSAVQRGRRERLVPRGARALAAERAAGGEEGRLTTLAERASGEHDLAPRARSELDNVSGLYIAGGQDFDRDDAATRVPYERALIREARNRGMPTLAMCGGSRVLAAEFGGEAVELDRAGRALHSKGLKSRAHPLDFPDRATMLGSHGQTPSSRVRSDAAVVPGSTVDKINSTHDKVIRQRSGELGPINKVPGVPKTPRGSPTRPDSELMVSATGPDGHPEGFETRFGAPMMGVTSHPEAIYGTRGARNAATAEGQEWSDHVMRSFAQASQTYARRQSVNQELRRRVSRLPATAESHPAVTLAPHLEQRSQEAERDRLRAGAPRTRFGRSRSRFGGEKERGKL